MNNNIGLLIINHGSPVSPRTPDVAAYLRRFLIDKRVLSLPFLFRLLLVRGVIVPKRARYSAVNYRRIWNTEDKIFPLTAYTQGIALGLKERLGLPTAVAMRYSSPSPQRAFEQLRRRGAKHFLVIPLYPQYAMSSYETAVQHVLRTAQQMNIRSQVDILPPFFEDPLYIDSIANSIRRVLHERSPQKLLISFHSIPVSHLEKTCKSNLGRSHPLDCCAADSPTSSVCYKYQCERTADLVTQRLVPLVRDDQVELVYQSRLGRKPWLQPYLSDRICELPSQGIRRVAVVCPGFVCDCLETLDEIFREERRSFLSNGGECFDYIPCLNQSPEWLDALSSIVHRRIEEM